ncbi:MAG TPA: mercuric reductase [Chloroflexia bacterium]|nr:mercuric reductase [Chloroflexia bacterium]
MTSPQKYDVIIIGAGQAGLPLSIALAKAGRKTAIIEREHVGGTCINEGCTPTKTMVASARVAYLAKRAKDYGVKTGEVRVDMEMVRQRKRKIVEEFRTSSEGRIERAEGLDWLKGEARFSSRDTVEVKLNGGGQVALTAPIIIINTGGRPYIPPVEGLDKVRILDSTSIMELGELPERLLVLGGGYTGLEFGQMFRRFGSQVTVVHRGERLMGKEDPDVADEVAKILREDGIEILLQTETVRADQDGDGTIRLTVRTPGDERVLEGSHLLVAVGRTPNTDGLNLEATGVWTDERGYIPANERLETNVPGIYAVGDVNGGPAFTHISYDDFRILRTSLIEGGNATTRGRMVPYTMFIDPQLGRVGLSETQAREEGRKVRVAKIGMDYIARALEVGESRGFLKAVVNADTGQILGVAALGIEGGEIMAMFQVAMMGNLPFTTLRDAVFSHPTLAESMNTLLSALGD